MKKYKISIKNKTKKTLFEPFLSVIPIDHDKIGHALLLDSILPNESSDPMRISVCDKLLITFSVGKSGTAHDALTGSVILLFDKISSNEISLVVTSSRRKSLDPDGFLIYAGASKLKPKVEFTHFPGRIIY